MTRTQLPQSFQDIRRKPKPLPLGSRELVKGRKGRPGQWGGQRADEGPRRWRRSPDQGLWPRTVPWVPFQESVDSANCRCCWFRGIRFCQDGLICRRDVMGWTERHKTKAREARLPPLYTEATRSGLGREDPKVKSKSVSTTHPPSGRSCYWETEDRKDRRQRVGGA